MAIFKLKDAATARFVKAPEIYADLQLGKLSTTDQPCFVIGAQVAFVLDAELSQELEIFWNSTWEKYRAAKPALDDIAPAYESWIANQNEADVEPLDAADVDISSIISGGPAAPPPPAPPPPPNRPVLPGGPPTRWVPPGHLPFLAATLPREVFYRFESWPTSQRLLNGPPPTIAKDTYASPASEEPFIPTGFAAVARCALPSFFPAVFKYEFEPVKGSTMRCGAIVPMYGQSGGGVEVMFPSLTTAQRPFVRSVIMPL